jgi:acylglycerol lipase
MYQNLEKTENFLINKNNLAMHYRYYLSGSGIYPPTIVVFHGYGSNINRPNMEKMAMYFNEMGFNVFGLDFIGHGYSEGERALINSADDLIDDAYQFVNYIIEKYHLGDFYLLGSSMGGTIAAELMKKLTLEKVYNKMLKGCILLSPLINLKKRYPGLEYIVENYMSYYLPSKCFPDWMSFKIKLEDVYNDPDYAEYISKDYYPANPDGLTWSKNIKFKSAKTILELINRVNIYAENINVSTLIIHDKDDKITDSKASQEYAEKNERIIFVETEGGKHDLVANNFETTMNIIKSFINK